MNKVSVFLNDIFKKRDSMNWNEITQGIEHIPGKRFHLQQIQQ